MCFTWNRIAIEKAKILSRLRYSGSEVGAVIGTSRMSCLSRANRLKEFSFTGRLRGGVFSAERDKARIEAARAEVEHVTWEWIAAQDILRDAEEREEPEPLPQPKTSTPAKPRLLGLPETVTPLTRYEKEFINLNRVRFLEKPAEPIVRGEGGVSIQELTPRSCRWILGDPDGLNTCYCGKRNIGMHKGGSSYCEEHRGIAWRTLKRKNLLKSQSTEPEAATEETNTFRPKRNSGGIASLDYSSGLGKSKTLKDRSGISLS
jgi:hypothetical protein